MDYIKTNQVYIVTGVIILIILGLVLFIKKDDEIADDKVVETATSTLAGNENTETPSPSKTSKSAPLSTNNPKTSQITNNPASESVPVILSEAKLNGSILRLISYNGKAISTDAKYNLSFENSILHAKFCNNISARFLFSNNSIKIDNFSSTVMYCALPADLMEIETNFISMLQAGATIYQSGDTIILSNSDKGIVMVFTGFTNQ